MKKYRELLFLNEIRGFGNVRINAVLDAVQSAEGLDHLADLILSRSSLTEEAIVAARKRADIKYAELSSRRGLEIITVFDPDYPKGLFSLKDKKPVILYAKGETNVLNMPGISVVGTRNPSEWTRKFGVNISKQMGLISGRIIVSGLALGCDRFAHEGALLAHVPTVAVLPSGVDVITPPSHKSLAAEILAHGGCLLSEYEPEAEAYRASFIRRDSLIAAITDITYVIECAEKSGTMHTVDAAYEMGRSIACYYPNHDALQKGARESDYRGNKKMIDMMGALAVSTQSELKMLLDSSSVPVPDPSPRY